MGSTRVMYATSRKPNPQPRTSLLHLLSILSLLKLGPVGPHEQVSSAFVSHLSPSSGDMWNQTKDQGMSNCRICCPFEPYGTQIIGQIFDFPGKGVRFVLLFICCHTILVESTGKPHAWVRTPEQREADGTLMRTPIPLSSTSISPT